MDSRRSERSRGIAVDVLPIQYDYPKEVWLERLDLPRFVKIGENYEAAIVLSSLQPGSGRLVVREQGQVISEQNVEFQAGKNRYTVPIKLREPGYYEYSATIETRRGLRPSEAEQHGSSTICTSKVKVACCL